jgi:hypothetical protein
MSAIVAVGGKVLGSSGHVFATGTSSPAGWQRLLVGAGGYVRGLNIAHDGTMVSRTDTNGAYYYNGSQWVQLFSVNSIPSSFLNNLDIGGNGYGFGCFEIQVAPTNTQIFYAAYMGYVWSSSNRGGTWTQTAFPANPSGMQANDNYGQYGQRMAVDPNNSNIVFQGTENNGLWYTINGGTSWAQVSTSSVPAGTGPGITGILFYGNGPVSGGATQTLYAASWGNGVYISTNGGSTWTLTSGTQTEITYAAIDTSGNYYAVGGSGPTLYKYSSSAWTQLFTTPNTIQAVAINPFNQSEVVAVKEGGQITISYNAGSTWTGELNIAATVSTDIPWIAAANYNSGDGAYFLDAGGLAFSPTTNGELILSAGTGVWQTTVTGSETGSSTTTWTDFSVSIEQLVSNEIIVPPVSNSTPVLASWDRPFFNITSLASYPSTYGPVNSSNVVKGYAVDYASSSPGTIVGVTDAGGESGYSTNNGASWTAFSGAPSGGNIANGTIAASTPQNLMWATVAAAPFYTVNQGASWTQISISGISNWGGFVDSPFINQRGICADRVNANTFYLYYAGNGVYISTNSGASWTQQMSGYIESNSSWAGFNSSIRSMPGNAGYLFYTPGNLSGSTPNSPPTEGFYRSINSGTSWTAVSNVVGVTAFNFGAVAPTYTYPSIYIIGYVGGVYGVWYSVDNASSWTNLGNPNTSLQTIALINCIAADPNNFGRVYVGMSGAGYAYYL